MEPRTEVQPDLQLQLQEPAHLEEFTSYFQNSRTFEHGQRVAKMLASSSLVPQAYQNNVQNTLIALEMANRVGASPLMVMQNLHIIQGKPSWSSSFIIGSLNSCGRFSPLRFEMFGEGDEHGCFAWAIDKEGTRVNGPEVTIRMAKDEGWVGKAGSKWKTMPELMLRYRAAAFFGRLYAPDILFGMQAAEEVADVVASKLKPTAADKEAERLEVLINDATTVEELESLKPHIKPEQQDLFTQQMEKVAGAELKK